MHPDRPAPSRVCGARDRPGCHQRYAGALNEEFHAALQALVADGTISQTQANTIREHGDTGSIDPRELVRDGVVSAAQMRTVADRLDDVKRNVARRLGESAGTSPSPAAPKPGQ
jgi:hypothetical protein